MAGRFRITVEDEFGNSDDEDFDYPELSEVLRQRERAKETKLERAIGNISRSPSPAVASHILASPRSPIALTSPAKSRQLNASVLDSPLFYTPTQNESLDDSFKMSTVVDHLWERFSETKKSRQSLPWEAPTPKSRRKPRMDEQLSELLETMRVEEEQVREQQELSRLTKQIQQRLNARKQQRQQEQKSPMRSQRDVRTHNLHTCTVFGTPNRRTHNIHCPGCSPQPANTPDDKMLRWVKGRTGVDLRY